MTFVCVPKELALLLGPNQQPTAAAINKTVSLFGFFLFFFLRGTKQLMVCLWETSKLCHSTEHVHNDARHDRKG